jgi:hypothetical protein
VVAVSGRAWLEDEYSCVCLGGIAVVMTLAHILSTVPACQVFNQ